jgi:hypothetical protein
MYDVEKISTVALSNLGGAVHSCSKRVWLVSPLSYYLPSREMPWDVDVDVAVEGFSSLDDEHSSHIKSSSTV